MPGSLTAWGTTPVRTPASWRRLAARRCVTAKPSYPGRLDPPDGRRSDEGRHAAPTGSGRGGAWRPRPRHHPAGRSAAPAPGCSAPAPRRAPAPTGPSACGPAADRDRVGGEHDSVGTNRQSQSADHQEGSVWGGQVDEEAASRLCHVFHAWDQQEGADQQEETDGRSHDGAEEHQRCGHDRRRTPGLLRDPRRWATQRNPRIERDGSESRRQQQQPAQSQCVARGRVGDEGEQHDRNEQAGRTCREHDAVPEQRGAESGSTSDWFNVPPRPPSP